MNYFFVGTNLRLAALEASRLILVDSCSLGLERRSPTVRKVGEIKKGDFCSSISFFGERVIGHGLKWGRENGLVLFSDREARPVIGVTSSLIEAKDLSFREDGEILAVDVLGQHYICSKASFFF